MAEDCLYTDHAAEVAHHLRHQTGTLQGAANRRGATLVNAREPRHSEVPDVEAFGAEFAREAFPDHQQSV